MGHRTQMSVYKHREGGVVLLPVGEYWAVENASRHSGHRCDTIAISCDMGPQGPSFHLLPTNKTYDWNSFKNPCLQKTESSKLSRILVDKSVVLARRIATWIY